MLIVADANIVDAAAFYEAHAELRLLAGRQIRAEDVRDADALLVRSITRVDRALLQDSRVQFVATATSGTDHLDLAWLAERGIAVAHAAGSNANAVVEYVLCALAELALQGRLELRNSSVAIIGYGHVGRRLFTQLQALGIPCRLCDPFVAAQFPDLPFCSLDEALQCPVITLHTPLTREGPHPTWHLLTQERLGRLAQGSILINAARGELVDNAMLTQFLRRRTDVSAVLDCWENEPRICASLLQRVAIASPHIAGYSQEAKRKASEQNYQAFLQHFGLADARAHTHALAPRNTLRLAAPSTADEDALLCQILRQVFPLLAIDTALREAQGMADAALFDRIRKELSARREFTHYALDLSAWTPAQRSPVLVGRLKALGFSML